MLARRDFFIAGIQIFLSALLLFLFLSSFQHEDVLQTISQSSLLWLGVAISLKSASLLLRELRLWLALPKPRPQFSTTVAIGLFTGALHTFLPLRGGDVLSVALLHKNLDIPLPKATFAVALCAFLEMLVFGILAILTLLSTQHLWLDLSDLYSEILSWISIGTGLGLGIFIIAIVFAKTLQPPENPDAPSLKSILPHILMLLQSSVNSRNYLIANIFITILDVSIMLISFACIFYCLGIPCDLPFTVSTLVLGVSAVAAFALPPSYGAGPAASAILVFSIFQLSEEAALAYAAIWWILSQGPSLFFGIPALWFLKPSDKNHTNTKVDSSTSSS